MEGEKCKGRQQLAERPSLLTFDSVAEPFDRMGSGAYAESTSRTLASLVQTPT
jgi:hypothetical protein